MTDKEIIQLRLKCLEPYVTVASKAGIEQDTVLRKAEKAWEFAIKPLEDAKKEITDPRPPSGAPQA